MLLIHEIYFGFPIFCSGKVTKRMIKAARDSGKFIDLKTVKIKDKEIYLVAKLKKYKTIKKHLYITADEYLIIIPAKQFKEKEFCLIEDLIENEILNPRYFSFKRILHIIQQELLNKFFQAVDFKKLSQTIKKHINTQLRNHETILELSGKRRTIKNLVKHFCKINKCSKKTFLDYWENTEKKFQKLLMFKKIKIDYGPYNELIKHFLERKQSKKYDTVKDIML